MKSNLGSLVCIVVLLAASCVGCLGSDEPEELETLSVTIGYAKTLSYLPIVAGAQGFFEDQALEVEIKEYSSGKKVLNDGLIAGEVDIAVVGLGPFVFESFSNEDLRIFGSVGTFFDLYRVVANNTTGGISTPADLMGKDVGTSSGSSFHYFLHNFLIKNDMVEEDVQLEFGGASSLPASLHNDDVQAISTREPFITEGIELLGADNTTVFSEPDVPANTLNLISFSNFTADNDEILERVLRALKDAQDYISSDSVAALNIVAAELEVDPANISEQWDTTIKQVSLKQEMILELESIARWAVDRNLTTAGEIPDYLAMVELEHLDSVDRNAVTIIR